MSRDGIIAGRRWEFDAEVADVFDDMLARSVPGYVEMRSVVAEIARPFLSEPGRIVDLGASRGNALASLLAHRPDADALAVEVSPPMIDACRSTLAAFPRARVVDLDLRTSYPEPLDVDVVLCVLTLQFIPIEHRYRILRAARRSLRPKGALVLVEKILGDSAEIDAALVDAYHERKRRNGYTDEQITRKALALEGVLVPVSAAANAAMLAGAGFGPVERVWQSLNFAAWLALRGGRAD